MKPALAHLSPTLAAALATGAAVALSVFLLAGAEPQGEPAPLLPAIGGAAVHVIADLPVPAHHRKAVARPESAVETATVPRVVQQRRPAVSHVRRPIRHARARVHHVAPRPVPVAHRAPQPAPVAARHVFRAAPAPRGNARGHSHSHSHGNAHAAGPAPAKPHGPGHGKALGHTHRGAPPGQAKKASAPPPAQAAPPKVNGGGAPPGHGGGNGNGGKK